MIKTLTFGDKQVQFSTSFAWTFIYKSQFGKDAAKVLLPIIKKIYSEDVSEEDQAIYFWEELGFTGIAEIAWAMARLADKTIPEPGAWVLSFGDDFAAADLTTELLPEAVISCFSTKKSLAPIQKKTATKKTEPKK